MDRSGRPAGLTPYGNFDFHVWNDAHFTWPFQWHLDQDCTPPGRAWPIHEAYFDVFLHPMQSEFTMDQTCGPAAYAYGYLAFRP